MDTISVTGSQSLSGSGQEIRFEETFSITHSSPEGVKLGNKNTLRVNIE